MTDSEKLEAERRAYALAMRNALDAAARAILDARDALAAQEKEQTHAD